MTSTLDTNTQTFWGMKPETSDEIVPPMVQMLPTPMLLNVVQFVMR